jgi:hypothetical protein
MGYELTQSVDQDRELDLHPLAGNYRQEIPEGHGVPKHPVASPDKEAVVFVSRVGPCLPRLLSTVFKSPSQNTQTMTEAFVDCSTLCCRIVRRLQGKRDRSRQLSELKVDTWNHDI